AAISVFTSYIAGAQMQEKAKFESLWSISPDTQGISCYLHEIDYNGNLYISGGYLDTVTIGHIGLSADGKFGAFLTKFDTLGNCFWVTDFKADNNIGVVQILGMGLDDGGNIFLTGYFRGRVDFQGHILSSSVQSARSEEHTSELQ